MATTDTKTKLIKILHDTRATICTKAGHHLKKIKEHSKILDKVLIQDNSITYYTNNFEKDYYGHCAQIKFFILRPICMF